MVRHRHQRLIGLSCLLGTGAALVACDRPSPTPTPGATEPDPVATVEPETPTDPSPAEDPANDTAADLEHAPVVPADPAPKRPRGLESGVASPEIVAAARKIQKDLECIRGVRFEQDVGVEFQSLDDFEAFLERQLAKEMAGGKDVRSQRLLHATGMIARDVDLMEVMRTATLEQAAAYYDPDSNTFYVVQSMPALALKAVMAHELQHALQDQHTPLLDRYTAGDFESFDQELAVRFLVEGEATMVGHAWTMAHVGDGSLLLGGLLPSVCHLPGEDPGDPDVFWPAMQDMLVGASEQTRQQIQDPGLFAKLATRAMSESMYSSMKGLADLPNFVFYSLLLPYNFGGLTVFTVFQADGYRWRAVDALFDRPPETTEQVLHPHKLGGKRREGFQKPKLKTPVQTGPHTLGWTFDPEDRIGELGIRIWFIERGATERQAAMLAEGWNGDTIRVWWRDDDDGIQRLAYDWKLMWDQPEWARRFRVAYAKSLPDRYPEMVWTEGETEVRDQAAPTGTATYEWTDEGGKKRYGQITWRGTEVDTTQGWTDRIQAAPSGRPSDL